MNQWKHEKTCVPLRGFQQNGKHYVSVYLHCSWLCWLELSSSPRGSEPAPRLCNHLWAKWYDDHQTELAPPYVDLNDTLSHIFLTVILQWCISSRIWLFMNSLLYNNVNYQVMTRVFVIKATSPATLSFLCWVLHSKAIIKDVCRTKKTPINISWQLSETSFASKIHLLLIKQHLGCTITSTRGSTG